MLRPVAAFSLSTSWPSSDFFAEAIHLPAVSSATESFSSWTLVGDPAKRRTARLGSSLLRLVHERPPSSERQTPRLFTAVISRGLAGDSTSPLNPPPMIERLLKPVSLSQL